MFSPTASVDLHRVFTPEECTDIIKSALKLPPVSATVYDKGQDVPNIYARKSTIRWIDPGEPLDDTLTEAALEIMELFYNNNSWNFALSGFVVQFTEYNMGEYYQPHFDSGPGAVANRKLSMSIQLSNPDTYSGGELKLHDERGIRTISRELGCGVIFPPYLYHEAGAVTAGTRYALVAWATGPYFK